MIQSFERPRIVGIKFDAAFIFEGQEFTVRVKNVAKRIDGRAPEDENLHATIRAIRSSKSLPERWPDPTYPHRLPFLGLGFAIEIIEGLPARAFNAMKYLVPRATLIAINVH